MAWIKGRRSIRAPAAHTGADAWPSVATPKPDVRSMKVLPSAPMRSDAASAAGGRAVAHAARTPNDRIGRRSASESARRARRAVIAGHSCSADREINACATPAWDRRAQMRQRGAATTAATAAACMPRSPRGRRRRTGAGDVPCRWSPATVMVASPRQRRLSQRSERGRARDGMEATPGCSSLVARLPLGAARGRTARCRDRSGPL